MSMKDKFPLQILVRHKSLSNNTHKFKAMAQNDARKLTKRPILTNQHVLQKVITSFFVSVQFSSENLI